MIYADNAATTKMSGTAIGVMQSRVQNDLNNSRDKCRKSLCKSSRKVQNQISGNLIYDRYFSTADKSHCFQV